MQSIAYCINGVVRDRYDLKLHYSQDDNIHLVNTISIIRANEDPTSERRVEIKGTPVSVRVGMNKEVLVITTQPLGVVITGMSKSVFLAISGKKYAHITLLMKGYGILLFKRKDSAVCDLVICDPDKGDIKEIRDLDIRCCADNIEGTSLSECCSYLTITTDRAGKIYSLKTKKLIKKIKLVDDLIEDRLNANNTVATNSLVYDIVSDNGVLSLRAMILRSYDRVVRWDDVGEHKRLNID